jgi:hypothetical protein
VVIAVRVGRAVGDAAPGAGTTGTVSGTQPVGAGSTGVHVASELAAGSWSGRRGSDGVGTVASPRVLGTGGGPDGRDRSDGARRNRATSTAAARWHRPVTSRSPGPRQRP